MMEALWMIKSVVLNGFESGNSCWGIGNAFK